MGLLGILELWRRDILELVLAFLMHTPDMHSRGNLFYKLQDVTLQLIQK
jgi:hypothetical protein